MVVTETLRGLVVVVIFGDVVWVRKVVVGATLGLVNDVTVGAVTFADELLVITRATTVVDDSSLDGDKISTGTVAITIESFGAFSTLFRVAIESPDPEIFDVPDTFG